MRLATLLAALTLAGCTSSMWDLTSPTSTPRNGGSIKDARLEIVQLSNDLRGAERQRAYAVTHTRMLPSSPKIVRLDAAITTAKDVEWQMYVMLSRWDAGEPFTGWPVDRLTFRRDVAAAVRASQRTMVMPDLRWDDGLAPWSFWRWVRTGYGRVLTPLCYWDCVTVKGQRVPKVQP